MLNYSSFWALLAIPSWYFVVNWPLFQLFSGSFIKTWVQLVFPVQLPWSSYHAFEFSIKYFISLESIFSRFPSVLSECSFKSLISYDYIFTFFSLCPPQMFNTYKYSTCLYSPNLRPFFLCFQYVHITTVLTHWEKYSWFSGLHLPLSKKYSCPQRKYLLQFSPSPHLFFYYYFIYLWSVSHHILHH